MESWRSGPQPAQHRGPGELVAAVLAGSWRLSPPSLALSPAALAEVAPLLLTTGSGSLGWWRIRPTELATCEAALELRQAYRLHTLQAARHEQHVITAITLLRSAGVEALLVKGWAIARLYPERGLRPYGDIDLCVRPEQHSVALEVLGAATVDVGAVDLHKGLQELHRPSLDEVYDRSEVVRLADADVRILGPEDHLRYACMHMLRHGAHRALWLCDVAVVLESLPEDFDWDYLLSVDRRRGDWVVCALGLAHHLLGARLDEIPVAKRARHLPRWLLPSVLRQWSLEAHYMNGPSMAYCLRHPTQLPKALRRRWPNPVQATVGVGGPFNELPRLPFQVGECLMRSAYFLTQVPRLIRQRSVEAVGRGEHAPVAPGGRAAGR